MKTIVLIGGTGLVGTELLKLLSINTQISKIYSLARSQPSINHPKIIPLQVDFDHLAKLENDFAGACFVSCLGTTIKDAKSKEAFYKVDFEYNYQFAQLAVKNKAEQLILVSAVGANINSPVYYSQVKGQLEVEISKLPLPSISILQPSLLIGNRKKVRPMEQAMQVLAPKISWLFMGGLEKYRPITAVEVAASIVNLSLKPQVGVNVIRAKKSSM